MSAVELVVEKVKLLSESQAESVLSYIERLKSGESPTARELRRMPAEERRRILSAQAAEAAEHYRQNPDLIVEDVDPPWDYEQGHTRAEIWEVGSLNLKPNRPRL